MASLREQILLRGLAVLTSIGPGVGAQLVSRSREVSITRAKSPAIVLMPANTELSRMAASVDKNGFEFSVEHFVRGDTWDSLVDPLDVAADTALLADAQLAALADIRRIGEAFEAQEADRTAGTLTVHYRATFLTRAGRIDLAP